MNILLLTHRLPYAPNRGDRIRAYHLIRALAKVGDVHLVSFVHDDEEASHQGDLAELTRSTEIVRVSRARNLVSAGLSLLGSRPLTHVLLHNPAIYDVLARRLRETPPDVVLAYCSGMARYACEPIFSNVPFVLDLVDVDSEKWRALAASTRGPKGWIFAREARLLQRFEVDAIRRAKGTTVVSERERVLLSQVTNGLESTVAANGIDVQMFAPPGPPADAPHVVFCGVFNYEPNEQAAIWFAKSVWPLVTQARPDARFFVVGMHPTAAVRALSDDPTIEVTGAVPQVRDYLWRSAVAVAPLSIARGLQNKVLEALAAGVPAVVTAAVAEGLPPGVHAGFVAANEPAAFAQAVLTLLAMPATERRAMARRADLSPLGWDAQLAPLVRLVTLGAPPT